MAYLQGEAIKIDTSTLSKMIGTKVEYLLKKDVNCYCQFGSRRGTITEIARRQVNLGNGEFYPFSSIQEMVKL